MAFLHVESFLIHSRAGYQFYLQPYHWLAPADRYTRGKLAVVN